MTDKEKVRREIEKAVEIVKSWPKWKQNELVNSLKATNDYCRIPVRRESS